MNSININNLKNPFDMDDFISKKVGNNGIDIEFIYNSDFKNAKILRDFIEVICRMLNFPRKEIARLVLIIDELSNNAIEYGTEANWENKLRVDITTNLNYIDITIEVEDTGLGAKPKTALEMETLRAHQLKLWYGNHESIRWRGLFMIIVKSVDRLYFKDTEVWWLIVWIKKRILLCED